jgi:hypothetical protein
MMDQEPILLMNALWLDRGPRCPNMAAWQRKTEPLASSCAPTVLLSASIRLPVFLKRERQGRHKATTFTARIPGGETPTQ